MPPSDGVLVIDTETTALPPRYALPNMLDAWEKCRIVQIAWGHYASDGTLVAAESYLVRPEGFVVPEASTKIHGISHHTAMQEGVPMAQVWERLATALVQVGTLVAHNMSFDDAVIQSEMHRSLRSDLPEGGILMDWLQKKRVCTMKDGVLPGQKWPKLAELYKQYFQKEPEGTLHTADVDVRVCAEIYFHQRKQGQQQGTA